MPISSDWTCTTCHETVPANFDLCWNCGTSRTGKPGPPPLPPPDFIPDIQPQNPYLPTQCTHCGSRELYTRKVYAKGNGINLLPGLGGIFSFPQFDIVLCAACGHCLFFADESRKKVASAPAWRRLDQTQ